MLSSTRGYHPVLFQKGSSIFDSRCRFVSPGAVVLTGFSLKPSPKAHVACAWAKYGVDEAAVASHMGSRASFLHISLFLSIFLGVAQHVFRYRNGRL
jgi:hypothetical protein